MLRSFLFGTALTIAGFVLFAIAPTVAGAASPQQATINGFVGTWNCITHSSENKTYHETDVDTMYGNWLRVDATYPAQNGAPAGTGVTFLGYDSKHGMWVVTGVGTDGSYFMSTSKSAAFNGSKWMDQYPNDRGTAVLHMTRSTQYSMDMTSPMGRKPVTQHAVCTKQ